MRLIRLKLQNFRQHADTEIEFRSGLTGIIGPNGAGKSTILEAIAWAVYGSAAARGTNDTIRFSRAPGRSRVVVDLSFELAGHEHRVVRSLSSAEVFIDAGLTPVATGVGGATEYLQSRLGMTREEFFNTYFTGQKELQFLAQMGAAQRARFLGQVLGYERLRAAQDRARARRNELKHEIEGIRSGLPDPAELATRRRDADKRLKDARGHLENVVSDKAKADAKLEKLQPKWDAACVARDEERRLTQEITITTIELTSAQDDLKRVDVELARIAEAEASLAALREQLQKLPALEQESKDLAEQAKRAETRRTLERQAVDLAKELKDSATRLKTIADAPKLAEQFREELKTFEQQLAETATRAQNLRTDWVSRKQEIETKLGAYRDRFQEIKDHLNALREAGPDGVCPMCERPLGEDHDKVVSQLDDEYQKLVQDGKWLRQRGDQLADVPKEVTETEKSRDELAAAVKDRSSKLARCESAVHELETLKVEHSRREQRLQTVQSEIAAISSTYDADRHRATDKQLSDLREVQRKAGGFEAIVSQRVRREPERSNAVARETEVAKRLDSLKKQRTKVRFREEEFDELKKKFETLRESVRVLQVTLAERSGTFNAAEQALTAATREEEDYRNRATRLGELELEHRHHVELDNAFSHLRTELNARVRPELGELASTFLTDITDGRYTALEIDDSYNVLVLDEGEEKPVISGGEEDIANLVLRLAISQMIAERAGQPLSILILDEVFGSLDADRRENVVQLLHRLQDRFDQVILITHIDSIREGLDNIIRVEFDERSGASIVCEESPHIIPQLV